MDIESRLAVAENKIEYYDNFIDKIEVAIDKMSEASSHISKMLAVHEERLEHASKTDEMLLSMVKSFKEDTHSKIESIKFYSEGESKDINQKIEAIQNDVKELQKLKWIVNGIGIAASITVVSIAGLFQGMLTPSSIQSTMKPEVHLQQK